MVVGEVEQHRDVGRERVADGVQLERRRLDHEDVVALAERVERHAPDVPDRGRTPAGVLEHRADSVVTVDLPFVPLTTTTGTVAASTARSRSPRTATPAARAATIAGWSGRTPGSAPADPHR